MWHCSSEDEDYEEDITILINLIVCCLIPEPEYLELHKDHGRKGMEFWLCLVLLRLNEKEGVLLWTHLCLSVHSSLLVHNC